MKRKTASLVAVMAVACSAAAASAATEVRLRERVVVASPVVRLGDVAEIVSADRAQARQLSTLPLMPAPASGTKRFLRQRELEDLLVAHGHKLDEIQIDGAAQVGITAPEAKADAEASGNRQAALTAGRIERAGTTAPAASDANNLHHEFRCVIENYLNTKSDRAATWRVSCDVAERHLALLGSATSPPMCRGGREPWTGRQRFVVSFDTAEGTVHVPVYAEVENLSYTVVVARRPIARGDVITAASVELQNLPTSPGTSGRRAPVTTIEKLIGMEARQSIQEGQVIFTDQVQPPVMIKRGELVTITSQSGGIRVRTTARARQDGIRGELVQVESLGTRERFDVRVIGPGEATVYAATPPFESKPAERIDTARRPLR